MLALSALAAVAAASTPLADASSDNSSVIRPGRSIGKFAVGLTEQQLRRVAGRPTYVVVQPRRLFPRRTVEWQYGRAGDYVVQLVGRPGRMRVNFVSTMLRRERTANKIGVGTRERVVREAYPTIRCAPLEKPQPPGTPPDKNPYVDGIRDCTLFAASGARTIFRSQVPDRRYPVTAEQFLQRAVVVEIVVSLRPCRQWSLAC